MNVKIKPVSTREVTIKLTMAEARDLYDYLDAPLRFAEEHPREESVDWVLFHKLGDALDFGV